MITTLANAGVLAACAAERHRLLSVRDLHATQDALLAGIIRRNQGCEYGRRHGFARLRSYEDFRARVPLVTYDDLADDVARVAAGRPGTLTSERVRLLEPSSGSTAATKLIPSTAGSQREFRRAIAAWLADLYLARPGLLTGRSYWSVTPAAAAHADLPATAVPVGFEDDAAYAGPLRAALLRRVFAVESSVARAPSMEEFFARTASALFSAGDLTLVSVWNPTYLTLLLERVAALAGSVPVPAARRGAARAAARGDWAAVWPRLRVLSCWADAHAAGPARELAALLPQATLQPKGLLATEGVVSVPMTSARGSVLAVTAHVVELVDSSGEARLADEAVVGERYQVALTTSGGLYRYRLGDEVEVTGWCGALPVLRFVGRADAVVDLVGEKLAEGFVGRALAGLGVEGFAVLSPEGDRYVLYAAAPAPDLGERLDAALRESFHYDHARRLGQLGAVEVVAVGADAAARVLEHRRAAGQRLGDIKASPLSRTSLAFLGEGSA